MMRAPGAGRPTPLPSPLDLKPRRPPLRVQRGPPRRRRRQQRRARPARAGGPDEAGRGGRGRRRRGARAAAPTRPHPLLDLHRVHKLGRRHLAARAAARWLAVEAARGGGAAAAAAAARAARERPHAGHHHPGQPHHQPPRAPHDDGDHDRAQAKGEGDLGDGDRGLRAVGEARPLERPARQQQEPQGDVGRDGEPILFRRGERAHREDGQGRGDDEEGSGERLKRPRRLRRHEDGDRGKAQLAQGVDRVPVDVGEADIEEAVARGGEEER